MNALISEVKARLLKEIPVHRTTRTVQILLIRQTHDYTVLRTEDTRELNVAVTPTSISNPAQRGRVVFLASKQKAVETREFAAMIKEYLQKYRGQITLEAPKGKKPEEVIEAIMQCEIKDRLCRACPRCTLFGAVVTEQKGSIWENRWNIKHRIEYSSAFSLEPYDLVSESITFNAVTESTQITERALGSTENVVPLVNFPSIVSLNSPTWEELVLVIKNLLRCKSYGAEGRIKGDTVNYITGLIVADEEVLTPLEYLLELSDGGIGQDVVDRTYEIAEKYGGMAALKDGLRILRPQELEAFVDYVQNLTLDKAFVEKAFNDSIRFAKKIEDLAKQER